MQSDACAQLCTSVNSGACAQLCTGVNSSHLPSGSTVAPPSAAAPATDMVTQLKELAELKDQGILTEEEFAAQKAKLLAG